MEENIGINLHNLELGNGFLDMTPKTQATTTKINWTSSKFKNICASNDTIKKVKKQCTEWDQIFANNISDKGLVNGIYKEH